MNEISHDNYALRTESMEMTQSIVKIRDIIDKSWEFIWKIDNWSTKRRQAQNGIDTEIDSKYFYSHKNGYKLRLSAYPNGFGDGDGSHFGLSFFILKGPSDDILEWPFKHNVEISLIDQQSGLEHCTRTAKYPDGPNKKDAFNKPINDENIGLGYPKFITLEEISTNARLCRGNQIFIKCAVKFV